MLQAHNLLEYSIYLKSLSYSPWCTRNILQVNHLFEIITLVHDVLVVMMFLKILWGVYRLIVFIMLHNLLCRQNISYTRHTPRAECNAAQKQNEYPFCLYLYLCMCVRNTHTYACVFVLLHSVDHTCDRLQTRKALFANRALLHKQSHVLRIHRLRV